MSRKIVFTYKYSKNRLISEGFPNTKVKYETDAESLSCLLEEFEHFLKAIGYVFEGNLDIVEEDCE